MLGLTAAQSQRDLVRRRRKADEHARALERIRSGEPAFLEYHALGQCTGIERGPAGIQNDDAHLLRALCLVDTAGGHELEISQHLSQREAALLRRLALDAFQPLLQLIAAELSL